MQRFYLEPDQIVAVANLHGNDIQIALDYLLSGAALPGCKLMLSDNHITMDDLYKLLAALADPRCPANLRISLENCDLTDEHMAEFARLFYTGLYPAGLRFDFSRNHIGDGGLLAIATALSNNREGAGPGVYFDLQYNINITNDGINQLAAICQHNDIATGTGFNLRNNLGFDHTSARTLAMTLTANTAITELDIETNDTGEHLVVDMDGDIHPAMIDQGSYQAMLQYCCLRNRLLLKYQHDPDMVELIHNYWRKSIFADPAASSFAHKVPSLRFFAAKALPRHELEAFARQFAEGMMDIPALTAGLNEIEQKMDENARWRLCPWQCNIL